MSTKHPNSPLGKRIEHTEEYSPALLHSIARSEGRSELGLDGTLPFSGVDIWNAYELSWLNTRGKPVIATAEFRFPANSTNIIESKSLKLYLNSLSGSRFESAHGLCSVVRTDLGAAADADVDVRATLPPSGTSAVVEVLPGVCIDGLEIDIARYDLAPELLADSVSSATEVTEHLYSHLLKTNCPVTGQPDWASILVSYRGPKIDREKLLAYLVSYRHHSEFHEQCVERIFVDLMRYCGPQNLTVYARYTRRGGLDINPFRSNIESEPANLRLWRQ